MLTTNVSANGTFSAAVGTMMGQHQDDKQSCEDVMAKYMAMSDTELSYEISRAEAAHSELLHTVADMISGLSKSGTTLSMMEKVSEPHHPGIDAMDGASEALDLGLISTVRPGLRC